MPTLKPNDIPLDWKIELDRHTREIMTSGEKIMAIIDSLPNKGTTFKANRNGLYVYVTKNVPVDIVQTPEIVGAIRR